MALWQQLKSGAIFAVRVSLVNGKKISNKHKKSAALRRFFYACLSLETNCDRNLIICIFSQIDQLLQNTISVVEIPDFCKNLEICAIDIHLKSNYCNYILNRANFSKL
jgi:hypothetical protein